MTRNYIEICRDSANILNDKKLKLVVAIWVIQQGVDCEYLILVTTSPSSQRKTEKRNVRRNLVPTTFPVKTEWKSKYHGSPITMPKSDSDNDSDSSGDESCSEPGMLGAFIKVQERKRGDLTQFEGFEEGDDGTVVQKMKNILSLRESLGMDRDTAFEAEQERKAADKRRMATMSVEERMQYEETQTGDIMSKIRDRHLKKQKELKEMKKRDDGERAVKSGLIRRASTDPADESLLLPQEKLKKKKNKPVDGEPLSTTSRVGLRQKSKRGIEKPKVSLDQGDSAKREKKKKPVDQVPMQHKAVREARTSEDAGLMKKKKKSKTIDGVLDTDSASRKRLAKKKKPKELNVCEAQSQLDVEKKRHKKKRPEAL
jgi:hypothetical protein